MVAATLIENHFELPAYEASRTAAFFGGPIFAGGLAYVLQFMGLAVPASITAAITLLCALWWITEAIPIPATSLIPFALFPLFDVLSVAQVAQAYGHPVVFFMLGGFILSTAMEKSGVHTRLAVSLIRVLGGYDGKRLVLGFMLTGGFLSMWISNAAATLMLLPIALATIEQSSHPKKLAVPLLLGIAYAASIGGLATPIGTPPNIIFLAHINAFKGTEFGFLNWMKVAMPITWTMLPLTWLFLSRNLGRGEKLELPTLPPWEKAEIRVLTLFSLTVLLWITRSSPYGGWIKGLNLPPVDDSTVAILMAVIFFLVHDGKGGRLLNWESAVKIPWGLLLLFGGGLAISAAFLASGLSTEMGNQLRSISYLPELLMIIIIAVFVSFLTEFASNTAVATLMMPILLSTAVAGKIDPALLMLPAVLSASCAFMLPVGTAPNAIVFGTGLVSIKTMLKEGLVVNIFGVVIISGFCYFLS